MNFMFVVVSSLFYGAAFSAPAAPAKVPTYGSVAADDFSKNLATINQNVYNGVISLSDPLIKLAVDTAPNLAHLYAIFNGVNVPPSLAALAKKLYGSAAVGGGKLTGDAAVLGSKILEYSMKLWGHGLQAGNTVIGNAAQSGINLTGKLGDYTASGITLGSDILASGLNTLGDRLLTGHAEINGVSKGISGVTDAIGAQLVAAIASVERAASQLLDPRVQVSESGALQFTSETQEKTYKILTAYVQILTHLQNLFNQFSSAIANVASTAAAVSASSPSINTASIATRTTNTLQPHINVQ